MYTEAFHRVLKYIYLKGTVNRRMDTCINVLLKYARDKAFERVMKYEKGKSTARIRTIQQRHMESEKLTLQQVHRVDEHKWKVQSASIHNQMYSVTEEDKICPYKCHLICSNCNVCIHMFSCSCTDALIHGTICKHIHLVIRAEGKNMTSCSTITNEKGSIPREIILKNVHINPNSAN